MWVGNEKPDWVLNYLPNYIANKIASMQEEIDVLDACVTWNNDNEE